MQHEQTSPPPDLKVVIVASDSIGDAEMIEAHLRTRYIGLQSVHRVSHQTDLLLAFKQLHPDLILTSFMLAGGNVIPTIEAIRQSDADLPILVMSGHIGEEAVVQVLKSGANDFMLNPIWAKLSNVIDREWLAAQFRIKQSMRTADKEREFHVLEAIVAQSPVGLWITNAQGEIVDANAHGQAMMGGIKRVGIDDFEVFEGWWVDTGQVIGIHDWPSAQAIERGTRAPLRLMRVRNFRGEMRVFNCGATPLFDKRGELLGSVAVATDETESFGIRERLQEAEARLREMSVNQLSRQESHIAKLSRDLHDDIGQILSLLKLQIGTTAQAKLNATQRIAAAHKALSLIDMALSGLKGLCAELSPSELIDFGLSPALNALCAATARTSQLSVSATATGKPWAITNMQSLALYRIAQQSVTNAIAHAKSSNIVLSLHWDPGNVTLQIRDDGCGFEFKGTRNVRGHGLRSMHERMELLHGKMHVDTAPDAGTTIRAVLPLEPQVAPLQENAA